MNFLRHEYFLESSREGVLKFIAELSGAQRAQRSTTGKKKFGYLVAYARTTVRTNSPGRGK